MKQLLLFLTTTVFFGLFSFSQVNVMWESRYNNNDFDDYSKDIVIDNAGNSYVVGTSYDGSQFDVVVIKYDPNGNELWDVSHNGPHNGLDEAVGIVIDSNDDVIIAGNHQVSASDFDIFAKKLDGTNGSTVWTYTYTGSANYDQLRSVVIDGNDNVILAGGIELGGADTDFVTASVSPAGNLNWDQTYSNSTNRDFASAVTVDGSNDVYVTGESYNGGNGLDYYTIKYDATGAFQWSNRFDGVGQSDRPYAITVAPDGNTYVVGASYRGLNDDDDIMLLKINASGGYVWDQVFGGSDGNDDKARSVTVDGLNNIYVTGGIKNIGNGEDFYVARFRPDGILHWDYTYQSSSNGFDISRDLKVNDDYEIYTSGYSNLSGSSDDYFTVRLDTLGDVEWTKRFDGPSSNSDQMAAFQLDDFGNIFVTGSSSGSGTLKDFSTIKYCQLETIGTPDDTICIGESVQLGVSGGMNYQWDVHSGDPITAGNFSCTNCDDPVASPSSTTSYTVSSENGSGCIDFDTVVVVVNPLPGPNISTNGPTSFCYGGSVDLTADQAQEYDWSTGEDTQTITADTTGTYSLVVTDDMGCQNSTDIDVETFENPVVDGGNDRFRCPDEELTFNATGADTYVWYSLPSHNDTIQNGVPFTPSSTSEYEVVGSTTDGCEDRDTVLVTIFPNPFQIELTQGMSGNLFINTSDGDTDWFLDGNSLNHTGTSFFYDSVPYCNGDYTVEFTDENGCMSFDTITISDACEDDTSNLSVNHIEPIQIYPNPTTGKVTIDFTDNKSRTITIHASNGRLIDEQTIDDKQFTFDLAGKESGTYFVTVVSDKSVARGRIVKQ
ncbi:MAG: T9SS type A sorting domain-containing protein [Brumimicrobium sp.]